MSTSSSGDPAEGGETTAGNPISGTPGKMSFLAAQPYRQKMLLSTLPFWVIVILLIFLSQMVV